MEWTDSLILGILQGITEFLPISSSGHLVLGEHFLGLQVESLKSFDVIVHMGTLLAILVYFRRDVKGMFLALLKVKTDDPYFKLIGFIVLATLPAVFVGLLAEEWLDATFRNVTAVAIAMIVVAFFFVLGEMVYKRVDKMTSLNWHKALIIGLAQAIALLPGVSRSGSTIVAGLFQGIERSAAARFSFLLGIPAIAGAAVLTFIKADGISVAFLPLTIGFLSSFIFGLLSVSLLMRLLKVHSLVIFAVYLLVVGISILI